MVAAGQSCAGDSRLGLIPPTFLWQEKRYCMKNHLFKAPDLKYFKLFLVVECEQTAD